MLMFQKLLDKFKLQSTREMEANDLLDDEDSIESESVSVVESSSCEIEPEVEIKSEPEPEVILSEPSDSCQEISVSNDCAEPQIEYKSTRFLIKGLHVFFIDVARDIVSSNKINIIPLMRKYSLAKAELDSILSEMVQARILNSDHEVLISSDDLEHLLDIYEPELFKCEHTIFSKDIFMCIGEIIFDSGIEDTYNALDPDEVMDYLKILETLSVIRFDSRNGQYLITADKSYFDRICSFIPDSISFDYQDFDRMSGIEFEQYCCGLLKRNGFSDVSLTKASGDHGIDVFAEKSNITYAIQCKCYSSPVGNAAIQQALSGKEFYKKDIAVVFTNRLFTPQAQQEATALGVKLWDRNILKEMSQSQ